MYLVRSVVVKGHPISLGWVFNVAFDHVSAGRYACMHFFHAVGFPAGLASNDGSAVGEVFSPACCKEGRGREACSADGGRREFQMPVPSVR